MFPNVVAATGSATAVTKDPAVSDHTPAIYNVPASVRDCKDPTVEGGCLDAAACALAMECDLCAVDTSYCPSTDSGRTCVGATTTPPVSDLDKTYFLEMMRSKHNCARTPQAVALGRKIRLAHFHNEKDKVVPYEGGKENPAEEQDHYSFEDSLIVYSNENAGCSGNLGETPDAGLITEASTRTDEDLTFGSSWWSG